MKQIFQKGLVFIFSLVLFAGSARAWKIADLEAEVEALKSRLAQVELREEKYRKEVEDAKKMSQEQVLEVRKDQADLRVEIEGIKQKLAQLQEMVSELSDQMSALENKVQALTEAQAQQGQGTEAEPASEAKPSGFGSELYNQALDNFKKGKYEVARAQFQAFLKSYPNDPYSDNAQFWIGECYFQQKDYKRAILEYNTVREKYPKGNKVPSALYKLGLCFEYLGKKSEAETIYKELIESYPNAEEAGRAKIQLEKLKPKSK